MYFRGGRRASATSHTGQGQYCVNYRHNDIGYTAMCRQWSLGDQVTFSFTNNMNGETNGAVRSAMGPSGTGVHTRPALLAQVLPDASCVTLRDGRSRAHLFQTHEYLDTNPRGPGLWLARRCEAVG